jgi:hypothetical protein
VPTVSRNTSRERSRKQRAARRAGWRTVLQAAGLLALALAAAARPAPRAQVNVPPPPPASYARFAFGGNAAEIPAQFIGNLVFLPVRVNQSQPSLYQLDSTAAVSSTDPDRAAELGLPGNAPVALELEGVQMQLPALPASAKKNFAAQVGRAYEGTLGQDFFANVVVEADYARKTVRLYDPADYQYSGRGQSLPLTFSGGRPVVSAKFSLGAGKPVEAGFVVNTALDASVSISGRYAKAHNLHAAHSKKVSAEEQRMEGEGDTVLGRLKLFEIGPYMVDAPIAEFSHSGEPAEGDARIAGEIGGGMLRRFTVIFDFPHQRIIFDANSNIREEDRGDMSGIYVVAAGPGWKRLEVASVRPSGPGAAAGVHPGDAIAGIDDEPAADFSLAELRALFSEPGHQHKLLLERNGQTITVNLRMRRLL